MDISLILLKFKSLFLNTRNNRYKRDDLSSFELSYKYAQ